MWKKFPRILKVVNPTLDYYVKRYVFDKYIIAFRMLLVLNKCFDFIGDVVARYLPWEGR